MSRLTKISLLLAFFFGFDKILGILRQVIIARQFGLSAELDAFNVANNLPSMLYALISGGALAIAFIPVLSETLTKDGRKPAWELFSRIANLAFLITGAFSIIIAILASPLVSWQVGIAPGFNSQQQQLVVELMRLNLIATLIFSISGLVMAGLQANQHFLLPAIAPLLYNVGQIFGAIILAPTKGYSFGSITLPAFGLGVQGLVYGVIIGAVLHLGIQIPGLIRYQFHWIPQIGLDNAAVRKVLRLMGPRIGSVFFIQLTVLIRGNLGSRLSPGSVSALSYGWMIMQVPETLIGTAIATALLPTLAEQIARNDGQAFKDTIERAIRVLLAISIPVSVILSFGLGPLISFVFKFDPQQSDLLLWVTRGYLVGLAGQCALEVAARSFYARQEPFVPLLASGVNVCLYIILGILLYRPLGAAGISLTDSLAFTTECIILLIVLNRRMLNPFTFGTTFTRAIVAAVAGGTVAAIGIHLAGQGLKAVLVTSTAMVAGAVIIMPLIWKEFRLLIRL
ncbi:MAG TPA: murein biosynthesis integral membrane protein MurJ [Anaerolineaceae bacterium]|nr:murein biosynthesis integral membrane protein MurJ [Anaerolineaceae bacterium]